MGWRWGAVPDLTVRDKVSYGLGSTAEAVVFTATSSFTLLFSNQCDPKDLRNDAECFGGA